MENNKDILLTSRNFNKSMFGLFSNIEEHGTPFNYHLPIEETRPDYACTDSDNCINRSYFKWKFTIFGADICDIDECIEKVIVQPNGLTIILWCDGVKTFVKPENASSIFNNVEDGIHIAIAKRILGDNKSNCLKRYMSKYGQYAFKREVIIGAIMTRIKIDNLDEYYEKFNKIVICDYSK